MDVVYSLIKVTVVLGLLVLTLRLVGRSRGLRSPGRATTRGGTVEILDQARVGRSAAIVTIRLGERGVAIAVTEQQVTVIGEIDLTAPPAPADPADGQARDGARAPRPAVTTLRAGIDLLRERTVRR